MISANSGHARRKTGINVPNQHIYKQPGSSEIVLMDEDGAAGAFDRAQRALALFNEQLPLVLLPSLLNAFVFPRTAAGLLGLFSLARFKGALDYTEERTKRMSANMLGNLCSSI